jgi:hypothetical protein
LDNSNTHIVRRTSADGITWNAGTNVITAAAGWKASLGNTWVLRENATTWKMLVDGSADGMVTYTCGLFTSTDGITWVEYGSNPLTSLAITPTAAYCGGWFDKTSAGVYRLWYHISCVGFGPSSLAYAESTDLINWTIKAGNDPVFFLNGERLLGGMLADQVADPVVVDTGSVTHLFYDVDSNVAGAGQNARIDKITYPTSMATLLRDLPWLTIGAEESIHAGDSNTDNLVTRKI